MAKVELKKPVVDEISANLEGAAGVVLVDHCGLTVEQDTQLRKQMREEGIVYKVYKNTMLRKGMMSKQHQTKTPGMAVPGVFFTLLYSCASV